MSEPIKVGDVVTTDGRPNMTVKEVGAEGRRAKCEWFEGTHFYEGKFFVSHLTLVPTEEGS
jgi:uncharacterized protein YodC (DUF2158 family)